MHQECNARRLYLTYFISYPRSSYPQNYRCLHLVGQMRNPILSLTAVALLTIAGTTTRVSAIYPGYNFGIADTDPVPKTPNWGFTPFVSMTCSGGILQFILQGRSSMIHATL